MSIISVKCIGQKLYINDAPLIASGDVKTDVVKFEEFSSEWNGFAKTVIFYRDKSNAYAVSVDPHNESIIPKEVLSDEGYFYFGVSGVDSDDPTRVLTSQVLRYKVVKGALTEGSEVPSITPDEYSQLVARMENLGQIFCFATAAEIKDVLSSSAGGDGVINVSNLNQYNQGIEKKIDERFENLESNWMDYTDSEPYEYGGE